MKTLYMAVTADQYELPLAVEESAAELGKKFNKSRNYVDCFISRACSGKKLGVKFVKVTYKGNIR